MTDAPVPPPIGFDTLLAQTWALFKRNWIIALPPVIAGIAFVVTIAVLAIVAIVASGGRHQTVASSNVLSVIVISYAVAFVVGVALSLWTYAAMYGMADAAWEHGVTSFADGWAAFRENWGRVLTAGIGMAGVALAALILAVPTLGLALIALPLFTMYVFPAAVSGGRDGFDAIGDSFRLVRRFFGQSAITALILYAIMYGIGFIGVFAIVPLEFAVIPTGHETAPRVPPIPLVLFSVAAYLIMMLVSVAYTGFVALARTGLYRDLAGRSGVPPARGDVVRA